MSRDTRPRLLARRSELGYVAYGSGALAGEPEAVTAAEQQTITADAGVPPATVTAPSGSSPATGYGASLTGSTHAGSGPT